MSRYLSHKYDAVLPYVPGEQPQDRKYIKLNTNELPFPPSPIAQKLAREEAGNLNLYSDPDCNLIRSVAAEYFGIRPDQIMFGNGSDDILNYAVMAYGDKDTTLAFPNVTYSFYRSIARLHQVEFTEIPVNSDLTINIEDYFGLGKTIIIANPNAPTGIALPLSDIEAILKNNPDNVVIIDEAYVDFGGESAVSLISDYDNLLVVRTFSKGNGLAGARLGFAMGNADIITDLNSLRNSTNPYSVNRMTMMAGIGALTDKSYMEYCTQRIQKTREATVKALKGMGFETTDSSANFIFVRHPQYSGLKLYQELKARGILIRHFETELLRDYNRITIGSEDDMNKVLTVIRKLLEEETCVPAQ